MSLHSAPSIVWELSGEPCETRDQALSGIKNNTEAFIICSRGDEFLQATCNSPEITIAKFRLPAERTGSFT